MYVTSLKIKISNSYTYMRTYSYDVFTYGVNVIK